MRTAFLFLAMPLIGCATADPDLPSAAEQVSQSVDAAPGYVCSEPAITGGGQAEASSIACWRVAPGLPLS